MDHGCATRWKLPRWGAQLERHEDTLEEPAGHEVIVRVTHAGICHSDLHFRAGGFDLGGGRSWPLERAGATLPLTMGHEIAGEVVAAGPEGAAFGSGERVVVYPWIGCGACPVCAVGDEHFCTRGPRNLGLHHPGGYADFVRVPHERYLVPIGKLDPARAATFACAGITALGAIRSLPAATAGDWIVVLGCGGVGITAIALLAALSQAPVIAVDIDPVKRDAAKGHGAALAVDANDSDAVRTIAKAAGNNVLGVLDFVGSASSSALALAAVRRGGRVVVVGLFGGELHYPLPLFPLRGISIAGSYVGRLDELRELVALAQRIDLPETPISLRPLGEVNAALEDLEAGRVLGRVVLQPWPGPVHGDSLRG